MTEATSRDSSLRLLAEPGERFGWIFQDRNLYRRRFLEPPPVPGVVPFELITRADAARRQMPKRITISLSVGLGLMIVFGCCAGIISSSSGDTAVMFGLLAFASLTGAAAGAGGAWLVHHNAQSALADAQRSLQHGYWQAHAGWDARRLEFDRQQQAAHHAGRCRQWRGGCRYKVSR